MLTSLTLILSYLANKLTPFHIMAKERTFIAVKPDGVQRGLIGDIIKRFETKGFKLVAMKFVQASEDHLKKHYSDLADKPFFAGLVKYMASAPLLAMCWEGTNVVKTARKMMGETKPADSLPGTIRGDYCIEVGRNIIHGSDSVESAEKEIALWFKSEELVNWTSASQAWIYEWTSKLGLIKDERGLDHLNNYLEDKSYIDGYVLSHSDFELHSKIVIHINDKKHPHVFRWFNHITNLNLENKQITNLSFTDEVTNFKVESKEKLTSENKVKKDFKIEYKEKVTLDSNDKEKVIWDSTYKEKVNFDSNYREKTNLNSEETKKTDLKSDKKSTKSEKPSKRTSKTEKRKEPKSKPHQQKEKESVSVKEIKNIEIKEMDEYNELTLIESKYNIVLEVRAKDEETNMTELEHLVRGITLDGLKWGNSQLISISYGTSKLSIICTFENNKSSVHDVMQTIMKLEDYVKTVDIAAFNKF